MPAKKKATNTLVELLCEKKRTTYSEDQLANIAFPVGGIGTGCVSFGGWGQLRDWEIFGRAAKGTTFNFSFFSMYAKPEGNKGVGRILQGPMHGPLTGTGSGQYGRAIGAGLPHFRSNTFTGEYPFGSIDLCDKDFPLVVSVEAFNPFIPLDDYNSGLPVAIFLVRVKNPLKKKVSGVLYANLENRVGHPEVGMNMNTAKKGNAIQGIMMTSGKYDVASARFGSMTLATTHKNILIMTRLANMQWFDGLTWFWDRVSEGKTLESDDTTPTKDGETSIGVISMKFALNPGESATIPIIITWHFPNNSSSWSSCTDKCCCGPAWKNYYGTKFSDAWAVAEYAGKNLPILEKRSRTFQKALFESTYPASVLDAVGSQISILKTPTCLRIEDGTFWGWEGTCDDTGCCAGTCSHVWNYTQAMPYLFPAVERTAREADYKYTLREKGRMLFRQTLLPGDKIADTMPPAADGQMGNVLRFYRDWKICGDDKWLKKLWSKVKESLEFAWVHWDADKDGVMEGIQHNTYDIEFYGPNTMMGSLYLGALRAGEEIANYLGETEKAKEYRTVYEKGRKWMDKNLFNGEWYEQKVMPRAIESAPKDFPVVINKDNIPKDGEMPKYQYGKGCLSDQLLGQWCAYMYGLGNLFDEKNIEKAAKSIFKYNFSKEFFNYANPQRIYAQDADSGTLLCSWPLGGRPEFPFPYSNEVWTGIEYAVAALLIYAGNIREGLVVTKAARDRHDGTRRNPWDEYECGHHYSRAMSSYSLMLALSGFQYSAPEGQIAFIPKVNAEKFKTFFSVDSGWGTFRQKSSVKTCSFEIEIIEGKLMLNRLVITMPFSTRSTKKIRVTLDGKEIEADFIKEDGHYNICFPASIVIAPKASFEMTVKR
jgi:non-lysosomal glucosylceramidase